MTPILQNLLLGISLAAPIGPANIAVIKKGLQNGFFAGLLVGIGVVSVDTIYLLLVYFGLSHLFNIVFIRIISGLLGAIILIYIGINSMREFSKKVDLDNSKLNSHNPFFEGFLVNISNPFAILWWTGVFGSTLAISIQNSIPKKILLINSMAIIIGLLVWVCLLAFMAHWGKKFLNQNTMRYISLIAGLILIGFGLKFGITTLISI